ncbi:MAG TPA: hypothetical protein VKY22_17935 [Bradyrhizobium sp.]|nr:hypothetical protein [Bradyrhizobium sp.]
MREIKGARAQEPATHEIVSGPCPDFARQNDHRNTGKALKALGIVVAMQLRMTVLVPLALVALIAAVPAADARARHHGGSGGHHGLAGSGDPHRGGAFASDHRHADDNYVKAAAEEEDKLLDSKIKSICRGC